MAGWSSHAWGWLRALAEAMANAEVAESGGVQVEGGAVAAGANSEHSSKGTGWNDPKAWGGTLMPTLEIQRMSPSEQTTAEAVAEFAANVRAQIRQRGQSGKGRRSGVLLRSSRRSFTASHTVSPRPGDLSAKLDSQWVSLGGTPASESMQRSAVRSHGGLLGPMAATASAFLPTQLLPSPPSTPRGSARARDNSRWAVRSSRPARVGTATHGPNGEEASRQTAVPAQTSRAPLAKGDLVHVRVNGSWSEEPGVVRTVWRSTEHESGQKPRTEVVVRFHEGGGWFKEEDVVRVGSTEKELPPLWHAFPEAVTNVSAAVALKKKAGGLTINDLLEGKVTEEQAAWMQVLRQREAAAGQDPFSLVRRADTGS